MRQLSNRVWNRVLYFPYFIPTKKKTLCSNEYTVKELPLVCTASNAAIHKAALPSFIKKKGKQKLRGKWRQPGKARVITRNTKFYHPSLWSKSLAWSWTPYIQQYQKLIKEKSEITWSLLYTAPATKNTPN